MLDEKEQQEPPPSGGYRYMPRYGHPSLEHPPPCQIETSTPMNPYHRTRGDNTPGNDDPIRATDAIAIYQSKWEGAGDTINYLQSSVGFALFIILPVALILIYQGIVLTRSIMALNKTKLEEKYATDQERIQQDLELERQKMREQLLEELKNEENKKDKK